MRLSTRRAHVYFCLMLFASAALFVSYPQTLKGRVVDETGTAVEGALVELANAALTTTSGADGVWKIPVPIGVLPAVRTRLLPASVMKGHLLYFVVNDNTANVKVSIYALNGRFICTVLDRQLAAGFYRFNARSPDLVPGIYTVQLQIGRKSTNFKLPVLRGIAGSAVSIGSTTAAITGHLEKRAVVIDTVKVSKSGYVAAAVPVSSYDDSLTVTLKVFVPAYHLDPPDPCYNRFYVKDCIPGDPNSACGGNCRVANSCSPPEDPSKSDLPKTFICPRFMLFSTEMLQAAKDDAKLYGWGNGDDPPFTYGVVGHDADVGGLDDVQSSCCQCYQIVFVTPEPSSPQPPELPYPKPLIVQSFNTAASGPKGFDVFMGAGGYGAFNSCYKDPAFSNTSRFDEFIYDGFPFQNPGGGGISFLRYPECIVGWPPTLAGVESAACQDKITQQCNQALVKASPQITEDTRRSCIQTNQVASLYHQNWVVMAKRVRCPDNLTRVTGCRLKEGNLPLPLPAVQTPAAAKTDGTFSEGYHTTTMQDCCKPTCAWADWTIDQKLPVDGEWSSFYSCDKTGTPITK